MKKDPVKVLIVDDDDLMAEMIQETLRAFNFKSYHAKYASEALLALRACTGFSLMIADLEMPGMGGERLIDEVVMTYKHLPIVVLSNTATDRVKKEELYKKGVREILEKPVPITDLEDTICRVLEQSELAVRNP